MLLLIWELLEGFWLRTQLFESQGKIVKTGIAECNSKNFSVSLIFLFLATQYRGYNLFREHVPSNRSCLDAGIPLRHCLCTQPRPVNSTFTLLVNETKGFRDVVIRKLSEYSCIDNTTINMKENELVPTSISDQVRQRTVDM